MKNYLILFCLYITNVYSTLNGTYSCSIDGEQIKSTFTNDTLNLDVSGIINKNCDQTIQYILLKNIINLVNYKDCFSIVSSMSMSYNSKNDNINFETTAIGNSYQCFMNKN